MVDGFQVPSTPSFEVVGNVGAGASLQIEVGIVGNVSVTLAATVIVTVVGLAHAPAAGVNT